MVGQHVGVILMCTFAQIVNIVFVFTAIWFLYLFLYGSVVLIFHTQGQLRLTSWDVFIDHDPILCNDWLTTAGAQLMSASTVQHMYIPHIPWKQWRTFWSHDLRGFHTEPSKTQGTYSNCWSQSQCNYHAVGDGGRHKGFWAQGSILRRAVAVLIINRAVPWKQQKGQAGGTLSAKYENL